jgi:hypothetical protein
MHSGEGEPSSAAALQLSLKHTASSDQQRAWTRRLFGHGWAAKEACGSIMASRLLQGVGTKKQHFLTRPLAGDDRLLGLSGFAGPGGATPGGFPPTGLRRFGLVSRGEGCQSPSQAAWRDVEWT